jgi:hypothetical protein
MNLKNLKSDFLFMFRIWEYSEKKIIIRKQYPLIKKVREKSRSLSWTDKYQNC